MMNQSRIKPVRMLILLRKLSPISRRIRIRNRLKQKTRSATIKSRCNPCLISVLANCYWCSSSASPPSGAATTACGGKNGSGLDSRVAFTGDNGAERTDPGVKTPGVSGQSEKG
nr:hypothetical 12.1 kD protein in udp-rfaH intergenic region - Escherichia coli (strain K-12) [Escherichia coli]